MTVSYTHLDVYKRQLLFLLRGSGRVSYEDGEVHNLPMGSIFAINRFQICDLDLDEDGLALSLCVSAETIDSFHIKLLKCEVKCQSFFYMEDQQEKFDLIRRDMARIFLEMYKNNEEQPIYMKSRVTALLEDLLFYFTSGEKVEQGRGGRDVYKRQVELMEKGNLDYIIFECLAERTVAIGQQDKEKDPSKGYNQLLDYRMEKILPLMAKNKVKVITNMGAANPVSAAERTCEIARKLGVSGLKIACVTGDDITDELDKYENEKVLEDGTLLKEKKDVLISANVYMGCLLYTSRCV